MRARKPMLSIIVAVGVLGFAYAEAERGRENYLGAKRIFDEIETLKWHYANLSRYEEVIEIAQRVINENPDTEIATKSQYLIVQCYDKQAKYAKKFEAFNKYVSMVQKHYGIEKAAQAIAEMGDEYFNLGGVEYLSAIKYYGLLLNKCSESNLIYAHSKWIDHAYEKMYIIYEEIDNYQKAVKVSQEYLRNYPRGSLAPSFQLRSALLYYDQEKRDKAISEFRKIIEKYPQSKEAQMSKEYIRVIKKGCYQIVH